MGYYVKRRLCGIDSLVGKTILCISGLYRDSEEVVISTDGGEFVFWHERDCCESVYLCDFEVGNDHMGGAKILAASIETNRDTDRPDEFTDSWTWSFYKIETTPGS